ncbi:MAG: hypothetical protein JTT12_05415 [Candidatus Brockarchaeota archaeon]|nr:hypothetical protein [Candidatus Brockarchaeota archaeon]
MSIETFNSRFRKICLPVFVLFPVLDIVTSYVSINYLGLYEQNPFVRSMPFIPYVILYISIFLGLYKLSQLDGHVGVIMKSAYITLSLISFLVVMNNVFQILKVVNGF